MSRSSLEGDPEDLHSRRTYPSPEVSVTGEELPYFPLHGEVETASMTCGVPREASTIVPVDLVPPRRPSRRNAYLFMIIVPQQELGYGSITFYPSMPKRILLSSVPQQHVHSLT